MALPNFTDTGDLPIGVHKTSLSEVIARFGNDSTQRRRLSLRLDRIYQIATQTGMLARFVVFGSFVTEKFEPNDVDVFMVMNDNFDIRSLAGEARLLFDHGTAQGHFGCSVFWIRRFAALGGEEAAISDWQIKRDGTERGIIEITSA